MSATGHKNPIIAMSTLDLIIKLRAANSPSVRDLCTHAAIEIEALTTELIRQTRNADAYLDNLAAVQNRCRELHDEIVVLKAKLYGTNR